MPVVEKYGLMVLFGLCALIVSVGIFAEDPLTEKVLKVETQISDNQGLEPANNEVVVFSDSQGPDWPETSDGRQGEKLMAYGPGNGSDQWVPNRGSGSSDPDPERGSSLGALPTNKNEIREAPRKSGGPTKVRPQRKARPQYRDYRVRNGDSLGRIAKRQLGSAKLVNAIREANPKIKNDKIFAGNTIRLPILPGSPRADVAKKGTRGKGRYITIKDGENLENIAQREYGDKNKWKALARRNGIVKPKRDLKASQKLFLPADL